MYRPISIILGLGLLLCAAHSALWKRDYSRGTFELILAVLTIQGLPS